MIKRLYQRWRIYRCRKMAKGDYGQFLNNIGYEIARGRLPEGMLDLIAVKQRGHFKSIFFLVLLAGSLQAQTVPTFLTQLDAQFNTLWQALTNRQATYLRDNENGRIRFWQGVNTHSVIPSNGVPVAADRLDVTAEGQSKSWSTIGLVGANPTAVALQVDEYLAPNGRGFVLTATAKDGTNIWVKVMNFGPESRRQIANWQANGVLRR